MADDCDIRLLDPKTKKKIFGDRDISDQAIQRWLADAKAIKQAFDEGVFTKSEMNAQLNDYIKTQRQDMEVAAQVDLADAKIRKKAGKFVQQEAFKETPWEAFSALMTKTVKLGNEAAVSIDAMTRGRVQKYQDHIRNGLVSTNTFALAVSGELDDEVGRVMHALNNGREVPQGLRPESVSIGKVFHEAQMMAYMDMRDAGLPVPFMRNRVVLQTHNPKVIAAKGFEAWAAEVTALKPDIKRLGPTANTPAGLQAALKGIYDEIQAGRYGGMDSLQDGELGNVLAPGRVSSNAIQKRSLVFGPTESVQYMRTYGTATKVGQSVMMDLMSKAKQTSMFERLGDRPRETFQTMIQKEIRKLEVTNPKLADQLKSKQQGLLNQFDEVAGTNSSPASEGWAKVNKFMGPVEAGTKLGALPFRSLANFAGAFVDVQTTTGQSMGESISGIMGEWLESLPDSVRKQYSKDAGDFLQVMQRQMNARMNGPVIGAASKMADMQMRFFGHNIVNDAQAQAIAILNMRAWGDNAHLGFEALNPQMQASMLSMGITKNEWPVVQLAMRETPDGIKIIAPESLGRDMQGPPPKIVYDSMKAAGFKGSAGEYLRGIENRMRAFLIQRGDVATTTAGPRERAVLNMGTKAGTPEGEIMRLVTRFKSFTAQSINISRTFTNATPNPELLKRGILASGDRATMSTVSRMTQYVVFGTALAYLGDSLYRASNGKAPEDPRDVNTWIGAVTKSGLGGMHTDFFLGDWGKSAPGEKPKFNFAETLVGPTLGNVATAASAITNLREGDTRGAKYDLKRIIRGYTPFQSAPLIRGATDYAQREIIDEMLNPGSSDRRKLRELNAARRGQ